MLDVRYNSFLAKWESDLARNKRGLHLNLYYRRQLCSLIPGPRELQSNEGRQSSNLHHRDTTAFLALESWVHIMYAYGFRSPDLEPGPVVVYVHKFTKGQPLGYYSNSQTHCN